jgi:cell division septation protein DedD
MKKFLIVILTLTYISAFAQEKSVQKQPKPSVPVEFCIHSDAMILFNMINDFRRSNKLPVIPLSQSLCFVAATHIDDLLSSNAVENGCGLHSWSDKGNWKPCCYSKDPAHSACMSNKPKELTGYQGSGYEVIYWGEETATPSAAMDTWRSTSISKSVFLNQDNWQAKQWKAMGVALRNGYAIVWLGDKPDAPADMKLCETDSLVLKGSPALTRVADEKIITSKQKPIQNQKAVSQTKKEQVISAQDVSPAKPDIATNAERFYLVVGSFRNGDQAEIKVGELKSKGYADAIILKGENVFRVVIGEYATREEAQKKLNKLAGDFKGIWILRQ